MDQDQIRVGLDKANEANKHFGRLKTLRAFQEMLQRALSDPRSSNNETLTKQIERNARWMNRVESQFNQHVTDGARYLGRMAIGATQAYDEYLDSQRDPRS